MYRILLVEDDTTITEVLTRQLRKWEYEVQSVTDFSRVDVQFAAFAPHLVLLDVSLPHYNGFHWCAQLRKTSRTPIVFISSASDAMNQVMALSLGADDYVCKPFNIEVVVAKLQAILRRSYDFVGEPSLLRLGEATIDLGGCSISRGGRAMELTRNELRILQLLFEHKGAVVTREAIMRRLWEDESFIDDNTLTVNIARLRKKLGEIGLGELIATRKGIGYAAEVPT